jgi:hypothetical protein
MQLRGKFLLDFRGAYHILKFNEKKSELGSNAGNRAQRRAATAVAALVGALTPAAPQPAGF